MSKPQRRSVAAALIIALPLVFTVGDAARRVTLLTLGRDQGIFQYVAWALRQGDRDYRDVRDVNGPLIHAIHVAFAWLGGEDEQRFRTLDLLASALAFAVVGAALPGLAHQRPKANASALPVPSLEMRAAWALAGVVVLGGQYLLYLYWDLAQRESFCDWFVLAATGLQLVAAGRPKRLACAAALLTLVCFGKPTYAVFGVTALLTLLLDDATGLPLRKRVAAFAIGAAAATAAAVLWMLVYADIGAFVRILGRDVPTMYRFIWPKSPEEIFAQTPNTATAVTALASSGLLLALVAERALPRRALVVGFLPLAGLVNVLLQKKGFPYHFHPVTAGTYLVWLALIAWLAERMRSGALRLVPLVASAGLALKLGAELQLSPHVQNIWILAKGETEALRRGRDYLVYFRDHDFFPWELRQAAAYLQAHTGAQDRVQLYGMDPYVLFLARRRSATPYIYGYDLDASAALAGGWSLYPTDTEAARIRHLRDAHEADLVARIAKSPPAAFVFIDKSPLLAEESAVLDFHQHCPQAAAFVHERYAPAATFGEVHVWLRRDLGFAADSSRLSAEPLRDSAPAASQ